MAVRITQPHPNLVGWWKLDDNLATTQVLDASGNGNHGTATANTNTLSTNGPFGENSAISLTWGKCVRFPDLTYLNNVVTFSIIYWFFKKGGIYNADSIFTKGVNKLDHYMDSGVDRLKFTIGTGDARITGLSNFYHRWKHWAWIFNGGGATDADRLKLYVDGTFQSLTYNSSIPNVSFNGVGEYVYIGGEYGNWDFPNRISDLRIYSVALSANEIYAHYVAGIRRKK